MSHFIVAVFSETGSYDEIEARLDPFCEQTEDPAYLEFIPEGHITDDGLMEFYECQTQKELIAALEDDFYTIRGEEYGRMSNPNAQWDWWVVGGRWKNLLRMIGKSERADTVKISDCDLSPDPKAYNRAKRFWEVVVEGQELLPGEHKTDFVSFLGTEWLLNSFGNKETYCERESMDFIPFAALDLSGEWMEQGDMGWFGISTSTKESIQSFREWFMEYVSTLKEENPDAYVTIVDCHI